MVGFGIHPPMEFCYQKLGAISGIHSLTQKRQCDPFFLGTDHYVLCAIELDVQLPCKLTSHFRF